MAQKQSYIVNRNIKRLIEERGMKSASVADEAGFSSAVFSNVIRCRSKVYADEVVPIALAIGVEIDELFQSIG